MKDSEGIIPTESEDYRPPAELYPYLTNVAELYEGEKPQHNCLTLQQHKRVYAFCCCADHRWSFSERILPPDYDHSPVSHFTELQSVSHQQLIPPPRHASEPLALHLEPTLTHLPMSPQVCSFLNQSEMEQFKIHFIDKYQKSTVNVH